MKKVFLVLGAMILAWGLMVPTVRAADLRDAAPNDVFLATYHKHNPERDYLKKYYQDILDTIQETRIAERFMETVRKHASGDDLKEVEDVWDKVRKATEAVNWDAVMQCSESLYAQKMVVPISQHLVLLRIPDGGAASLKEGMTNLFRLAETASEGKVSVVTETFNGVQLTVLNLPTEEVPFTIYQPCVAVVDDVFVFSSLVDFAKEGLTLLKNPSAASKFDDSRVSAALEHLPAFEDGLTFFDGHALFDQLRILPEFIKKMSEQEDHRDPAQIERVTSLITTVLGQFDVFDFELTVEYTEGYQNRSASLCKLAPESREKVLGKMIAGQQPFSDWSQWVPADASSYALDAGVHLHPLYEWTLEFIQQHFPESEEGLARFAELQEQYDLHLDADLLQPFSGGSVSVTLPGAGRSPLGGGKQSVTMFRCSKPDRIRELLHSLVDALQQIPQVEAQHVAWEAVENLDGFEELKVDLFRSLGIQPVVGFREGWLVIGSHADAVSKVLDTQSGGHEKMSDTDTFKQFDLKLTGPVLRISYRNLGKETREGAMALQQVGMLLPMLMAMIPQDGPDMQPVQEFLSLLPSLEEIIGKFDFYEGQLNVVQPGPDELSYKKQTVTTIRPPKE